MFVAESKSQMANLFFYKTILFTHMWVLQNSRLASYNCVILHSSAACQQEAQDGYRILVIHGIQTKAPQGRTKARFHAKSQILTETAKKQMLLDVFSHNLGPGT